MKLDLGFNDELSSTIPTEIGNLVQLRKLLLSSTSLSGALPESLKSLKHLHIVVLMRTNLEGPIFDFALNWPEIRKNYDNDDAMLIVHPKTNYC